MSDVLMFKRASNSSQRQTEVYRTLLALAFTLLTAVFSSAQTPTPTPQTDEPRNGSISGRVMNENGQPLMGAAILVRLATPSAMGRTVSSNIEGDFQVKGLDPALYQVSANAP